MSLAIDINDRSTEMEEIREVGGQSETPTETNRGMPQMDVGKLQTIMQRRIGELPGREEEDPSVCMTIFRLPYHETNKELCEPKVVSIGPYHRDKPSLRTMENHKWVTLRSFLAHKKEVGLEFYLRAMKSIEAQVRGCYGEPVDLTSDDFVMMLLLDGCFILEWLSTREYSIFYAGWNKFDIFYDFCLMENQLPFKVIHTLFNIQEHGVKWSPLTRCPNDVMWKTQPPCPVIDLFNKKVKSFSDSFWSIKFQLVRQQYCELTWYLLELYREGILYEFHRYLETHIEQGKSPTFCSFPCFKIFFKSRDAASGSRQHIDNIGAGITKDTHIMCVSELSDAGVKFKKKKRPNHMFDISFQNGIIEMPALRIDSHFVRTLWNLVAYEQIQFDPRDPNYLSSYFALMDALIDTEKDIAILERAGIVDNYLSNAEEAAAFFNQFSKTFVLNYENHHFHDLFKNVREYSESTWPKYRAKLVQDYFSNPWAFISVLAAMALFALTILQTYYSAISV